MRLTILAAASLLVTSLPASGFTGTTHFSECTTLTGRTATVIIPLAAAPVIGDQEMQPGDELAVFTPDGICAGTGVWKGQSMAIAVWADDPFAEDVVGFEAGSPLAFRAYQAATGLSFGAEPNGFVATYQEPYATDGIFHPDAIFVMNSLAFGGTTSGEEGSDVYAFALEPAFPNPFGPSTTFAYSLPTDSDVALEVFDILGRRVAVVVDEPQRAGQHQVRFEPPAGIATGVLIARLRAGTQAAITRLTHVR